MPKWLVFYTEAGLRYKLLVTYTVLEKNSQQANSILQQATPLTFCALAFGILR